MQADILNASIERAFPTMHPPDVVDYNLHRSQAPKSAVHFEQRGLSTVFPANGGGGGGGLD